MFDSGFLIANGVAKGIGTLPMVAGVSIAAKGWEEVYDGQIESGVLKIAGMGTIATVIAKLGSEMMRSTNHPLYTAGMIPNLSLGEFALMQVSLVATAGLGLAVAKAAYNALTSQAIESK